MVGRCVESSVTHDACTHFAPEASSRHSSSAQPGLQNQRMGECQPNVLLVPRESTLAGDFVVDDRLAELVSYARDLLGARIAELLKFGLRQARVRLVDRVALDLTRSVLKSLTSSDAPSRALARSA